MKFSQLAHYIEEIEETSARNTITSLLAELFKKLKPEEIDKAIYLLQGKVAPSYESIEFGFAEKMVARSAASALQLDRLLFDREYKKIGDLGKAVEYFKKNFKSFEDLDQTSKKELGIVEVFESLRKLAGSGGKGSQEVKINILAQLIRQLDPLSCRYLVRMVLGVLRLGFSDMTVLDALSWMVQGDKSIRPQIEATYHVRPDLGLLGRIVKEKGIKNLKEIRPKLFTPILMMRAERLSSAKEILDKVGECAVEPKYDGFRLQVHYLKKTGEVRLYSRNLEEVSLMYPDIIAGIKKEVKAKEAIIEGEAIGFDPHSGSFLPFQETVQRKRKYDIEEKAKEIPLKFFAFELLYLDGKTYLFEPFLTRRKYLAKIIRATGDLFKDTVFVARSEIIKDEKKLEILFEDSVSKGLEGVVAKKLTGIYQAGARGWNWIKFKKSYDSKIEDTIDCLVMGYDYGKGKRTGFGLGAFLVGVYDKKNDEFVTVAKIGTGLTDEEWKALKIRCDKYKAEKKPAIFSVDKQMGVDVWVKPKIVVEIKADEITRSPVHTAGRKMKPSKSGSSFNVDVAGYALRFPRLISFRDDKRPEEVTTLSELEKLYIRQKKKS